MAEALEVAVEGARTQPIARPLVTTIWKAGSPHFAGGSEKFSEPTKPVEAWPQSWGGLVSRVLKGQKLPFRDDKREHPHLGLYFSPHGFRSNREGDVVQRTGLHVDIDEGTTEDTITRLVETLRAWGLAAIVQRRDVIEPYERKLRAIVPLTPDEGRETFYSRASAFLIALSEAIDCPIDLSPAVWSQPTFIYGPVRGREKPRVVAQLEGAALDLRAVEGMSWGRRVGGEACVEAVELCRAMFEEAGSVFRGHRGTRPPDGDNPSSIELLPDGEFRCWTQPTYQVRAWLRTNVPEAFRRWWHHPGRRVERARSTLRTRQARVASSHATMEQLPELVRAAVQRGGQHVFVLPRNQDVAHLAGGGVLVGKHAALETLSLSHAQLDALRRQSAQTRARHAAKQQRVRTFFEYIVEDLFFAGHLHTIPEWTLPDRVEEQSVADALDALIAEHSAPASEAQDEHLREIVDAALARDPDDELVDAERIVRRLFDLAGTLQATKGDGRVAVACIPEWTQRPFVLVTDEPDPALEQVCPEAHWVHVQGTDGCEVERIWYVTADEPTSLHVQSEIDDAKHPLVCVRGEIQERLDEHDALIIVGMPLTPDWHPEAAIETDAPRDPGFWRAMESRVEAAMTELERSLGVGDGRTAPLRVAYFGPSFPAPPWPENGCSIVAAQTMTEP